MYVAKPNYEVARNMAVKIECWMRKTNFLVALMDEMILGMEPLCKAK